MPEENRSTTGPTTSAPGRTGRPWSRRRSFKAGFVLVLAGLLLVWTHRPLLVGFASLFRADDPAPSDALVILTDSPEAARAYRCTPAPVVLLVATDPLPFPDLNPTEVGRQTLIRRGIPAGAIRLLPPVGSVADLGKVARRVRESIDPRKVRRITLVATSFQSARARRTFRRVLGGTGIEVRVAAVRSPYFDESDWYRSDEGLVAYFQETVQWIATWFGG
jgi:uncharacterized SAM-binding protein YcdF (DUF218 family)